MITYFIIIIFLDFAVALLSPLTFLPDVTLDPNISSAIAQASHNIGMIFSTAPLTITALFISLLIIVGIETHIFTFKTINYLIRKIPFIS